MKQFFTAGEHIRPGNMITINETDGLVYNARPEDIIINKESKMNEAIKLAIEKGGYKSREVEKCTIWSIHENPTDGENDCLCIDHTYETPYKDGRQGDVNHYYKEQIALDPLFWKALGKALGWKVGNKGMSMGVSFWLARATDYFEIKLTGGDEDAFWKDLLND